VAALDSGKLVFQSAAAEQCLTRIRHLICDQTSREARRPACLGILQGKLADGEQCAFSTECASNECSIAHDCTGACCTGTCVGDVALVPGRLGDRCQSSCIDSTCRNGLCVPLRDEGDECRSDSECDYGLACLDGLTCVAMARSGEACVDDRCRNFGEVCMWSSFTCEPGGLAGAPCLSTQHCSPMYTCDTSSGNFEGYKCVPRLITVGAPCRWDGEPCEPPAFCATGAVRTCTLPRADGDACDWDYECEGGHCHLHTCNSDPCF
jgi:hypothetical protein